MPDTPIINKVENHLDKIDKLREGVKDDVDGLFKKLNVKNFIANPVNTTDALIYSIMQIMIKKYIKPILKESREYCRDVIKSNQTL